MFELWAHARRGWIKTREDQSPAVLMQAMRDAREAAKVCGMGWMDFEIRRGKKQEQRIVDFEEKEV